MGEPVEPSSAVTKYGAELAQFNRQWATYQQRLSTGGTCGDLQNGGSACAPGVKPTPPTMPKAPPAKPGQKGQPAAPQPPQLTPQQVAQIAVARLTVPTVKAGIGPPPEINKWKMAVVGYPLWLYANGATHLGPVAQNVGDQAVSLDATLASITYKMGDGNTKTCPGAGTPWTSAVQPGASSPTCGYSYQQPSLPKDSYTVTATWAVTWTINGQTGVITIYTNSSRQLPVGELQALVR